MPSTDSVTPEEIIEMIVEEMQTQAAPMRYSVVVPCVYHIFLDPDEYQRLRLLFPEIERDAKRALSESLEGLNRKSKSPMELFSSAAKRRTYRRVGDGEWMISFYENHDQEAEEDPVIVRSLFDEPRPSEERAGTATERASRPAAARSTSSSSSRPQSETQRAQPSVYALIEYQDEQGPQRYEMTKSFVRIGRRVKDETLKSKIWADLVVAVSANVSKEHCEIRWDEGTRGFFLKDTSKFGTSVNGQLVSQGGEVRLPEKAKIQLADAVTLQFRSKV